MISPHVRRHRLARELDQLRRDSGYTIAQVAGLIGVARQRISRLLNGHVAPAPGEIAQLLTHFDLDAARREQLLTIARQAATTGWWEPIAEKMGPRQAMFADLEAGAIRIDEYQMTLFPGLLQIPPFTEARCRVDYATRRVPFDTATALEARSTRQSTVHREGGPNYQVVLDELAVRRPAAPIDVVIGQLDHIVQFVHASAAATVRVLPLAAEIANHAIPLSSFSIYRYPDPDDPVVVAIESETNDQILAYTPAVSFYVDLHERLAHAAMAPNDSLDFLANLAEEMRNGR
jgi:transcriptional regulator with XRE-family HTH domain